MGSHRKQNHTTSILADREEQIEKLGVLIQAYRARISHIQTRLLSTFDILHELRSSHARELSSETQAKERLSEKLDLYVDIVKAAEIERDDLKDAVLQLVEKVELSNDYGLWPHSRIQIASHADPTAIHQDTEQNTKESDEDLLGYASAMIASLRLERDAERKAHNETRRRTASRISALEAQLACREAELESCVVHTDDHPSMNELRYIDAPESPTMTHDEVIRVLDMTSAKNKTLEMELKILVKRLEKARLLAHQASASHRLVDHERGPSPTTSSIIHSFHNAPPSSPTRATHPSHVPTHFRRPASHNTELSLEDVDPTIRAASPEQPPRTHHPHPIEDLDHQIRYLASTVDAFKAERDILSQVITAERPSSESSSPGTAFERLLLVEEECVRLRISEEALKADLENSNKAALAREKELMEEIEKLQHLAQGQHVQNIEAPRLLEAFDGEMSMELATPLYPTSLLPRSRSRSQSRTPSTNGETGTRSPYIDPPSIPLPLSPTELSPQSPVSRSSPPPTVKSPPIPSQPPTGVSDLQRVERELADAKRQLEQGENVVSEWQNVLGGMQFHSG